MAIIFKMKKMNEPALNMRICSGSLNVKCAIFTKFFDFPEKVKLLCRYESKTEDGDFVRTIIEKK